ncbi:hypothetical protein FQN54_001503 [Arachnomyces sp. PD_36]|nr:hypothetical protein FQN54_001503 [Arachnomyces sp. PD_36]
MTGVSSQSNNGSLECDVGYDVAKVSELASTLSEKNWEWGTQAQALLELHDPDVAVFSSAAFPQDKIPKRETSATDYARSKISTDGNTLTPAGVSAADPASLGVSAILLGQSSSSDYAEAATRQADELLNNVPRYDNDAISHRYDATMLWSDFIYMAPPFLAYQGVATNDLSLLRESVRQIRLYREVLQDTSTGLWTHIAGARTDEGTWSTGNGWVLYGIARVFATISHWGPSSNWQEEKQELILYAREIIDGAIDVGPEAESGLLRNYITSSFPEAAGTAIIAASIYRWAVLAPEVFANSKYLNWADERRAAVVRSVGADGVLSPVVNPYDYLADAPLDGPSPEAQSFGVMLYAAYCDCERAGYCSR